MLEINYKSITQVLLSFSQALALEMLLNSLPFLTLLTGIFGQLQTIVKLPGQTISINDPNAKVTHGADGSVRIDGAGFQSFSAPNSFDGWNELKLPANRPKPDWIDAHEPKLPANYPNVCTSKRVPSTDHQQRHSTPPLKPGVKIVETNYADEPGRTSMHKTGDDSTVEQKNYGPRRRP